MSVVPLQQLEDSFVSQLACHVWFGVTVISLFVVVLVILAALSLFLAFPFDFLFRKLAHAG